MLRLALLRRHARLGPRLAAAAGRRRRRGRSRSGATGASRCCSSRSRSSSTSTWARRAASSAAGCCPPYPALCVLAGYGASRSRQRCAGPRCSPASPRWSAPRACSRASTSTRVLGREDTRAQALDWIRANVPGGRARRGRAVRARLLARRARPPGLAGRAALPGLREAPARAPASTRYREQGYCWVVVGSTQKDRGLKAGLRSSRSYYRGARRRERADGHVLALRARRRPRRVLLRQLVQLPRRGPSSGPGPWSRSTGCALPR